MTSVNNAYQLMELMLKVKKEKVTEYVARFISRIYEGDVTILNGKGGNLAPFYSTLEKNDAECIKNNLEMRLRSKKRFSISTRLRGGVTESRLNVINATGEDTRIYVVIDTSEKLTVPEDEVELMRMLGCVLRMCFHLKKEEALEKRDPLTGLLNRDCFMEDLRLFGSRLLDGEEGCIAMFALSNADTLNKERGVVWTDRLVQRIANFFMDKEQAFYRTGGVRFTAIIPSAAAGTYNSIEDIFTDLTCVEQSADFACVVAPLTNDVYKTLYLAEHFLRSPSSNTITLLRENVIDGEWLDAAVPARTAVENDAVVVADSDYREVTPASDSDGDAVKRSTKKRSARKKVTRVTADIMDNTEMEDFFESGPL